MKNTELWAQLSGNTPLAAIRCALDGRERTIYAKLEWYNPSGSIKDRIAFYMLAEAERTGALREGQPIAEMTSGNTGIALAAAGAYSGREVHIFMPERASEERKALMRMYGAKLHLVSAAEGGFRGALEQCAAFAKETGAFVTEQFSNRANERAHYLTTGEELLRKLPDIGVFVAGVGSGGTLMGTARRLKADHSVRAVAVEPQEAALLSGASEIGEHRIEGIGDSFIPPLVDRRLIDAVRTVHDGEAIYMAQRLARELGLGVGISSGANFLAALREEDARPVATVFADDNKKYLSTALAGGSAPEESWLAARVELLDFRIL